MTVSVILTDVHAESIISDIKYLIKNTQISTNTVLEVGALQFITIEFKLKMASFAKMWSLIGALLSVAVSVDGRMWG
jgi:hypothetical protein